MASPALRCYVPGVENGYLSEMFVSFQGEGLYAGRRHLFIRLAGCNLRCRYCDTPGSLETSPRFRIARGMVESAEGSNPVSPSAVVRYAKSLLASEGRVDGVAVTGGEPLLQADFLAELLRRDELPHPRLLETNGVLPDGLETVLSWVDVVSMDIKLPSNTGEPAFWPAHGHFLALARGKAYVKILVDAETRFEEVEQAVEIVRADCAETPVFLQPVTHSPQRAPLEGEKLRAFYLAARKRLTDVRVMPQLHKILADR